MNRGGLEDAPFSYRESGDGKVFLSWRGQSVLTLKGAKAASFLKKIEGLGESDAQRLMARATGNFKRGNERGR